MKLMFFLENEFYCEKESPLTKYYRIRSILTVFKNFFTFFNDVVLVFIVNFKHIILFFLVFLLLTLIT